MQTVINVKLVNTTTLLIIIVNYPRISNCNNDIELSLNHELNHEKRF